MKHIYLYLFVLGLASCTSAQKQVETTTTDAQNKVLAKKQDITNCYGKNVLDNNQTPEAELLVGWDIDEAGKVINAEVLESSTENAQFKTCLVDTINSIEFARPGHKEHATIKMPFVFTNN